MQICTHFAMRHSTGITASTLMCRWLSTLAQGSVGVGPPQTGEVVNPKCRIFLLPSFSKCLRSKLNLPCDSRLGFKAPIALCPQSFTFYSIFFRWQGHVATESWLQTQLLGKHILNEKGHSLGVSRCCESCFTRGSRKNMLGSIPAVQASCPFKDLSRWLGSKWVCLKNAIAFILTDDFPH